MVDSGEFLFVCFYPLICTRRHHCVSFILWSNVNQVIAATKRCAESDRWVDRHQTPGRRPPEACVRAKAPTSLPRSVTQTQGEKKFQTMEGTDIDSPTELKRWWTEWAASVRPGALTVTVSPQGLEYVGLEYKQGFSSCWPLFALRCLRDVPAF